MWILIEFFLLFSFCTILAMNNVLWVPPPISSLLLSFLLNFLSGGRGWVQIRNRILSFLGCEGWSLTKWSPNGRYCTNFAFPLYLLSFPPFPPPCLKISRFYKESFMEMCKRQEFSFLSLQTPPMQSWRSTISLSSTTNLLLAQVHLTLPHFSCRKDSLKM